ncbi:MAG TPA: biotin--[acetyl-CoA-carboxylase] ligase, partial [Kofleriaceae bacterium]|nr:biotin--[acetyl-CoA-carboxylase] ligase [Kofleriaceae bacterium]
AAAGAEHGTVVVARAQRSGRGRLGRSWLSAPGESLTLSCVLRPALAPDALPPLTLAAGVALAEAVAGAVPAVRVHWPNDVVVGDRKLAGILTEMTTRGGRVDSAVLGIGLNVNNAGFPPDLGRPATSLLLETGRRRDLDEVRSEILDRLEVWLERFFAEGMPAVARGWRTWGGMAGARVRVDLGGGRELLGTAGGLAPDGGLEVTDDAGRLHVVRAGDVTRVRPGA